MSDFSKMLSTLALAALMATSPVHAQDSGTTTEGTTTEGATTGAGTAASGSDLALGEPVPDPNAPGTSYIKETNGDWEVRCIRTEDGSNPCQAYQLLKDQGGNTVAEFTIFELPEGEKATAGATIAVPLETLLTQQITFKIDGGEARRYPFSWCSNVGCFSRVGFTAPEIAAFKAGSKATLTIVPAMAPDQQVVLTLSLSGFTAGYDSAAAGDTQ